MIEISKQKVLFVGAGPSQLSAIVRAINLGYEVYAIDENINAPGLKISTNFDVGDIRNHHFIELVARRFNVDAILGISTDAAVPSVARACEILGLPSIGVGPADISVNKLLQRQYMKKAGLKTPAFRKFLNLIEASESVNEIGFPVVLKPVDSAGSRGVKFVSCATEVELAATEALKESRSKTGLVEKYIEGSEVAIDGFIVDGSLHVLSISEKVRTHAPYLLDEAVYFPDTLPEFKRKEIISEAGLAIASCGLNNCPLHMELLMSNLGPIVVEMAARGAGFNVFSDVLPHVAGVETVDIQLNMALGKPVDILTRHPLKGAAIIFIPPTPGRLKSVIGLSDARGLEGVYDADVYIQPGSEMGDLTCGADRVGHIIALSENRQIAEFIAKKARDLIRFEME